MKKLGALVAVSLLSLVLSASPSAAATNLIVDGGFEAPGVSQDANAVPNGYVDVSTNVGAWQVVAGDVNTVAGSSSTPIPHTNWWQPAEGLQSLDLNGTVPGKVVQTIPTTLGSMYTLTFRMAGNFYNPPAPKTVRVVAGSTSPVWFTFDATASSSGEMGWVTQSMTFTATTSATAISFESLTPSQAGAALDDVSVMLVTGPDPVVPEAPLAVLLPIAGSGIGVIMMNRRRRIDRLA
jgi:choice-of-anchor C domain-containing protein